MQSRSENESVLGIGAVIDPTKNVIDLVHAEAKYQDSMRDAQSIYQNSMRKEMAKHFLGLYRSEIRRQNDLAKQRELYNTRMSDVLTAQIKTTAELVSTQLDKFTTSLAAQISSVNTTLDGRISLLERFRYELGGRTSVSDPAAAQALESLFSEVKRLERATDENVGSRRSIGVSGMVVVQVISSIASTAAVIGVIALLLGHRG